jgi:hypothetical protein
VVVDNVLDTAWLNTGRTAIFSLEIDIQSLQNGTEFVAGSDYEVRVRLTIGSFPTGCKIKVRDFGSVAMRKGCRWAVCNEVQVSTWQGPCGFCYLEEKMLWRGYSRRLLLHDYCSLP